MKKYLLLALAAASVAACNNANPVAVNTTVSPASNDRASQTAIAHNTGMPTPPAPAANGQPSHWKQSGEPIDTKDFDTKIAAAEVALKKSPTDTAVEKKLADAYFDRASALTEAKQYASALGDYRRAVKHDPSNAEAKEWVDKIISIYNGMGREFPKEGEEPPPLEKPKQ